MAVMIEGGFQSGAVPDPLDTRDRSFERVALGSPSMTDEDWERGADIEKTLNITLPIKNQGSSLSCVGQAYSYYAEALFTSKIGRFNSQSAKAIYSQIALPGGGATFRDGAKILTDFGSLLEASVPSYRPSGKADESWMVDTGWRTSEMIAIAQKSKMKEYRSINTFSMDMFALAIRDYGGIVAGVVGTNNGTWSSNEPKPPKADTAQSKLWNHAMYFGKFGIDSLGKYIASPQSWGTRKKDSLHPDGWQKLRESWFVDNGRWLFNPWVVILNNEVITIPMDVQKFLNENDLKFIRNQETGAMGQIINKKLRVATGQDRTALMLMDNEVRRSGKNITDSEWKQLPKVDF